MTTQPPIRTTPKEHDLKIWSRHFEDVLSGKKKAEHRVNDRDFQVGDTLQLREVTEPESEYTGRKLYVTVTHIIRGGEMDILSIEPQDTVDRSEISLADDETLVEAICDEIALFERGSRGTLGHHIKRALRSYRQPEPVSVEVMGNIAEEARRKWWDGGEGERRWQEHHFIAKAVLDAAGVPYVE